MPIARHTRGLLLGALCLCASLSLAPQSWAGFDVVEDTDWSGNLGSPFLIPEPLGVGANTIRGTLPTRNLGRTQDTDVFEIDNPSGLPITGSITLEISDFVAGDGTGRGRLEIILPNTGSVFFSGNGTFLFSPVLNDPSTLEFRISAPAGDTAQPATHVAGSADYTVTINSVPEPSTLGVLLVGTLAAGAVLGGGKREPRRPGLGA